MVQSQPLGPPVDPDAVARRLVQQAHVRDGLPEIAIGFIFLFVAAGQYAGQRYPKASVVWAVLLPVLTLASPKALRWVRERYLIDRSGYVRGKPANTRVWWIGVLGAVLALAAVAALVAWGDPIDKPLVAGTGLLIGGFSAVCGRELRFYAAGAVAAVTGLLVTAAGLGTREGFGILFGVTGAFMLISGLVGLFRFK